MTEIYVYKIDRDYLIANETSLTKTLGTWRRDKVSRIKVAKNRMLTLAAGLMCERVLSGYIEKGQESDIDELGIINKEASCKIEVSGIENEALGSDNKTRIIDEHLGAIDILPSGKPVILGMKKQFNLSHSGDYVVLAVSDNEIGIDIECKSDKDFKIAKRCFNEEEQKYIEQFFGEEKNVAFRDIWTMKESCLKLSGNGITVPLKSILTVPGLTGLTDISGNEVHYDIIHKDEYSISVCSYEITEIHLDDFDLLKI